MIPTWVPDWTSKEEVDEIEQYAAAASARGEEVFFNKSDRSTFGQPEYRIDDSSEGDVHLRVRARQLCVIEEAGIAVPEYPGLRISRQQGECKIIAPKSALPADEIWLLAGASRPVLLREEGKGEYAFLGEVVVVNPGDITNIGSSAMPSGVFHVEGAGWKDIWLI
jgi:hypothetical protein